MLKSGKKILERSSLEAEKDAADGNNKGKKNSLSKAYPYITSECLTRFASKSQKRLDFEEMTASNKLRQKLSFCDKFVFS